MLVASITTPIGKIFQPLLDFVGAVLAFFYSIVPNYPIDVALLTIVIMAALTPLTVKSTKNMAAMQALGPEMKKLQQKYKGADNRTQMNEEMMKLYKEHNVNPASGCLPMLLQMPAFFILYSVIRGMTNTVTVYKTNASGHKVATLISDPRYIPKNSEMFRNIKAAGGHLNSFGMDFSEKLLSHHSSIWIAIPYLLLVAAAVGLQYLQMSRLNARNPQAAQANPQAAMMQKYMPLIFGFIYLNVAAILNVYFIVLSPDPLPLRRSVQQAEARRAEGRRRDRLPIGASGRCPSRRPRQARPRPPAPPTAPTERGVKVRGGRRPPARAPRRRSPAPPTERMQERVPAPATGTAPDRATPNARATGATVVTDRDPPTPTATRRHPRSTRDRRRSVRERLGK